MRKGLLVLLIFALSLSLVSCDSTNYEKAAKLYGEGAYAEAQEIFLKLGDYEDSAERAEQCRTKIAWHAFADFVQEEVQYVVHDGDGNPMLITCDGKAIYVGYNVDPYLAFGRITYAFSIWEDDPEVKLHAEGHFELGGAYMDDRGTAQWNIATYRKGNMIYWDEYNCSGKQVNGSALAPGTTGIIYSSSDEQVKSLTSLLEKALRESGTGTTMKDLGFLSY